MGNLMNPHELMAATATVSAVKLLGVKTSFARLARYMAAIGAEGTYNGRDIYETLQGVHDMVSAALGYLVSPEEEAKLHGIGMAKDDEEFDAAMRELEEGGHA
ncbi:MAG: hypothetical protein II595_01590 [Desulfovibrio sp.]|nr:hypothetical protein [Desulfovibrio sp.]